MGTRIWLRHQDGYSGTDSLTRGAGWAHSPAWSPDAGQVVFVSGSDPSHTDGDLYVINRDGTGLQQLTSTPDVNESNPAWRRVVPLSTSRE